MIHQVSFQLAVTSLLSPDELPSLSQPEMGLLASINEKADPAMPRMAPAVKNVYSAQVETAELSQSCFS